jgi:hypothetical protein
VIGCALPMRSTLLMTLTCGSSRFIIAAKCQGPTQFHFGSS